MKAMQRGPRLVALRCVVVYSLAAVLPVPFAVAAERERELEDYAEVYVDEYFEPDDRLLLSDEGHRKSRALAHYALGRMLESEGRTLEAVESYEKVLENAPDQHFLARKTAYLLARNGSNEEALDLLEQNLEKNPDEPYAHISLSEYLSTYRSNDPEGRARAFEVIEKAVDEFPEEPAVYEHAVKLYLAANREDDARELIQTAAERDTRDPVYWLRLGRIAGRIWPVRQNGRSEEGELVNTIYGKALDLAGKNWDVVESVADYYHATRQFDRALQAYDDVLEANPDRLDVREKLVRVYGGMGNEEMVIRTLQEMAEIDPGNAEVHKRLAGIYMRQENYGAAIPHLRKSLSITDGSEQEYGALGRMMFEAQEYEAAAEFLDEASYRFPESPDFPFLLSLALTRLERWDEAVESFESTVELAREVKPQMLDESFYFQYAAAHERAGNLDEAEKLFRKTMELIARNDPDDQNQEFTATVYNYLGYMWLENDRNLDEAGELIKTAADLDPESGAIADSLGWFYFKKGRFEEARDELLRAEQMIETADPVVYDHIGRVFHELGEPQKAVEYLEKAVELDPESEEFTTRLEEYREIAKSQPAEAESKPKPGNDAEPADAPGADGPKSDGSSSGPDGPKSDGSDPDRSKPDSPAA